MVGRVSPGKKEEIAVEGKRILELPQKNNYRINNILSRFLLRSCVIEE